MSCFLANLTDMEKLAHKKIKILAVTQYILQGGVRWYANCGFSFRSSVSFGQERTSKSAPTTRTNVSGNKKSKSTSLNRFVFNDINKKTSDCNYVRL